MNGELRMNRTRATCLGTLLSALLAASACSSGSAGPDASTYHPLRPDAASAQTPPDAAVEGGPDASAALPDAGPPARSLVPMHLLGGTPLDNRVLDPNLNDLSTWLFFALPDYKTPTRHRVALPASPVSLPAIEIPENGNTAGVVAASYVMGGKGPFTASVWLGQPAAKADPNKLSAQVLALDANSSDVGSTAFDLTIDKTSHQVIGDIHWDLFTARIDTELLGWGYFWVADQSGTTLYATGATLVEDTTRMLVEPMPGRPLTPAERTTLGHLVAETRRRLHGAVPSRDAVRGWPTP